MNIVRKIDRYIGVRLQSLGPRARHGKGAPLAFLGGMNRTGNHLIHSLLDGHPGIKAVPEEDWFLSRNISSVLNQFRLFYNSARGNVSKAVDMMLRQNEGDFWRGKAGKEGSGYKVDFDIIDYSRFRSGLEALAGERNLSLRRIYQGYVDCVLDAVPTGEIQGREADWKMYFVASSDYLVRPIMSWDPRNKAIVSIRDPLQRFGSIKKWSKRDFICDDIQLTNWKKVHESYRLFREIYAERILFVDYDGLVTNTGKAMRRLADFLGVEFDDILTRPTLLGRPVHGNTSFSEGTSASGVIYRDSLTKYKKLLTQEEIDIINGCLRPLYLDLAGKGAKE